MSKKIVGNPVGIPNPISDMAQTDPTKADYVRNKKLSHMEDDVGYAKTFIVNVAVDSNGNTVTADKKTAEIVEAYTMGKQVIAKVNNSDIYTLCSVTNMLGVGGEFLFSRVSDSNVRTLYCVADFWRYTIVEHTIDTEMSDTSENAVQNKVIKKYVDDGFATKTEVDDLRNYAQGIYSQVMIDVDSSLFLMEERINRKLDLKADKSDIGDIETALDSIIAIQNELIGGETV